MKKIFNIFLILFMIFIAIFAGCFALLNLKVHDKYVKEIINHQNFKDYIVVNEDIDDLKYDDYLIYVNKSEDLVPSPIEKSGIEKDELIWAYTIEIKVNEKFAELSKEKQFELIQNLSQYLKDRIVGIGPLHKGFYQYLSLYYDNQEKESINDGESFYKSLDLEVYEPNSINGLTKEEWIAED